MIRPPTAPTTVDKLTGLPDRWAWETHAAHLLNNARNTGDHVALLLVDLDHFKTINDTWGHLAGDAVLAGVARVLRTVVSFGNGVIGRYGGDEFLVMLAHADIQRPIQVAESLLRHIGDLAVTVTATSGNRVLLTDISASIGLTTTPPDKLGCIGRLVLAADAALLHAKQNGRNQVRAGYERLAAHQSTPQAQLIQQHFPESPVQALDHNACLQHLRNFSHMVASGHWNPDVLLALSTGPRRYTELLETIRASAAVDAWTGRKRHIHDSILHRTLRRLERDGLLHRTEESAVWPRYVTYELTPAAHKLLRAVMPGVLWSHQHQELITQAQQRAPTRAG
jgi:diguanylate cyclase (GGDEF)-like protein